MGTIDPSVGWAVIIILLQLGLFGLSWKRTIAATRRNPSVDTDLGTLNTRLDNIEKDLDATKSRLSDHEDKISRQIGALHARINDVFGELRELSGILKAHVEKIK
ncbi:hypothetical protein EGM51_10690 [Verrucomicrobia bacterium S94]|nr:hypothetical protein EGM51_10690 [Verrucomicrobia bacterium S94]